MNLDHPNTIRASRPREHHVPVPLQQLEGLSTMGTCRIITIVLLWVAAIAIGTAERPILQAQQLLHPVQSRLISSISVSHPEGFTITKLSPALAASLSRFASEEIGRSSLTRHYRGTADSIEEQIIFGPTTFVPLSEALAEQVRMELRPALEQFCGCKLEVSTAVVHGARIYHPGAVLVPHVDWPHQWVISASINVAHNGTAAGGADWPLMIGDTNVTHQPGHALLYEGARLSHGRPTLHNGSDYVGVFVGFVPVDYPAGAGVATQIIVYALRISDSRLMHQAWLFWVLLFVSLCFVFKESKT